MINKRLSNVFGYLFGLLIDILIIGTFILLISLILYPIGAILCPEQVITATAHDNPDYINGYHDALDDDNTEMMRILQSHTGLFSMVANSYERHYYGGYLTAKYDMKHGNTERINKYKI
jgi:hypothetical protein